MPFIDRELLYSATARCKCGSGLAYPLDHTNAMGMSAWVCARVLRGETEDVAGVPPEAFGLKAEAAGHEAFPFMFWKIREETSINNVGAHTTRPPGTIARTVGKAKCPQCVHEWQSEPYVACGLPHHWLSGPCPNCGHAVGGGTSYRSGDGPAIETRFPDVVLDDPA